MISSQTIAWFAGLVEGEGSFYGVRKKNGIRLVIRMGDRDIIERCSQLLCIKMGVFKGRKPHYKPQYGVCVSGQCAAGWMMTLYKFLGKRRRQRIRELLPIWKNAPGRGRGPRGSYVRRWPGSRERYVFVKGQHRPLGRVRTASTDLGGECVVS